MRKAPDNPPKDPPAERQAETGRLPGAVAVRTRARERSN
jgi:hypothetical protein